MWVKFLKAVYRTIDYQAAKIFTLGWLRRWQRPAAPESWTRAKPLLAEVFKLLRNGRLWETHWSAGSANKTCCIQRKVVDRALQSAYFSNLDEVGEAYALEGRKLLITISQLFQIGIAGDNARVLWWLPGAVFRSRRLQADIDEHRQQLHCHLCWRPELRAEFKGTKKERLVWDKWSGRTSGLFKDVFQAAGWLHHARTVFNMV